jgi:hypothetical protein
MDDADIYKTAFAFIEKFGDKAFVEAAIRSDEMVDSEDPVLLDQWNDVMQAIQEIHKIGLVHRREIWMEKRSRPYNAGRPIN